METSDSNQDNSIELAQNNTEEPIINSDRIEPPSKGFSWQVMLMITIVVLAWSTPNIIGRYLQINSVLTPIQISTLRYIPAALTLLIFCFITKRGKQLIIDLKEKYYHLIIASLILTSFVLLQMYSVKFTEASASAFLLNVNPVITFVLSLIILKERHRWWGGIGILIAATGIFFIAVPLDKIDILISSDLLLGNILAFLSGVAWAIYTVYLKKFLKDKDPVTVTTWNLSFSAIILTITMFVVDGWFETAPAYYHIILTTFLGIVPTSIAFTLWFETLKQIPVQKASAFQFLIPVIATLFALAMGETIDLYFGLGGGLILIGLVITQFS
ncbi:MAG: DMT family transporter [Asgard group archaeon]|nr:DMT family transporter [Asgard group archaeon]